MVDLIVLLLVNLVYCFLQFVTATPTLLPPPSTNIRLLAALQGLADDGWKKTGEVATCFTCWAQLT